MTIYFSLRTQSGSMILFSHLLQTHSFRCLSSSLFHSWNPFLFTSYTFFWRPSKTCSKAFNVCKLLRTEAHFLFHLWWVRDTESRPMSAVLTALLCLWGHALTPKRPFSTLSLHSAYLRIPSPVQEMPGWEGEREECRRARSEVRFIMDSYLMGFETKMPRCFNYSVRNCRLDGRVLF